MSPSPKPLQPDGTQSSDYFEDDSVFLEALRTAVLPGDPGYEAPKAPSSAPPATANPLKRPRTDSEPEDSQVVTNDDDDTYAPSKFDGFGDYMRRKRAKLQIQNAEFDSEAPKIYKDLAIYVSQPWKDLQRVHLLNITIS